jgi:hypothetical protein
MQRHMAVAYERKSRTDQHMLVDYVQSLPSHRIVIALAIPCLHVMLEYCNLSGTL